MAKKTVRSRTADARRTGSATISSSVDDLLARAAESGSDSLETGRYLVSFREGAEGGAQASLKSLAFKVADTRDFKDGDLAFDALSSADAVVFSDVGVALVGGDAMIKSGLENAMTTFESDQSIEVVEPEYFVFADNSHEYLRGFNAATAAITRGIGGGEGGVATDEEDEIDAEVLGATWGLGACRVPRSVRSGAGIKVAVLDTGFDLRHPDFVRRPRVTATFVGQPVQDGNGHGTHCIGTACGPKAPAGSTPRYGIAYGARIHVGKVLTNGGSGTGATVLGGMNWAIRNRCEVISMSLGSRSPVQSAYSTAGAAALRNGCLIIAAAGNDYCKPTGAPANSPTIMAVASLDKNLAPSNFSNCGKIEIAAPGRDVYSAWPMPRRYHTISGTSMATPHVAGCAALWAQTSPALRAMALWRKLQATARRLPYPATKVGAGLVQAP